MGEMNSLLGSARIDLKPIGLGPDQLPDTIRPRA
jgi:hypothetical protein